MMTRFEDLDPALFMYIGGFVGILLLLEGARAFLGENNSDASIRAKRIEKLGKSGGFEERLQIVNRVPQASLASRIPIYGTLPAKMSQAGMTLAPAVFLAICAAVAGSLFIGAAAVLGIPTAAVMAALTGMVIPMSIINIIRKKRVAKFAEQLPDALDLMMRGLRVGHPLNVTIQNVAENMPDPLGTEFQLMANQITYGDDLVDAFFDLADRIDQEDMHYLSVSVAIQHGTGGNLAAMLGTLAKVIRGRFTMRRRIAAISSEGRITAWVLSSLPFMMYGATMITAPGYYASVQDDPLYLPIATVICVLVVTNFLVMRKLVNFRI